MATPAKVDPKPLCKYGAKCYRRNEQHMKQYRHPKRENEEEDDEEPKKRKVETLKAANSPKTKGQCQGRTIQDYFGRKKNDKTESETSENTSARKKEETSESFSATEEEGESDENETEMPESPADVRENIKSKFLVEMPDDFYDFWRFCEQLNKDGPLDALQDTLGFTLVGPYDILAGRHKDVAKNSAGRQPNFLLHWRYYYDPPEFLTVIKGDDEKQFHIGYFRDDPKEMPVFVATNCAKENGLITPRGDNLFAVVSHYTGERLKDKIISAEKKKALTKLQESLKTAAANCGCSLELKTKAMKERDKNSVCKTFHGAGMVVPVDDTEVGYRPVPETPADLKKILTRIHDSKREEERDKHFEPLQEIITLVQFANDECDYGEGLELGLDLFTFGGKCFHSAIRSLLTLAYQLLGRPQYSRIIEAHLKRRSHSVNLSQID